MLGLRSWSLLLVAVVSGGLIDAYMDVECERIEPAGSVRVCTPSGDGDSDDPRLIWGVPPGDEERSKGENAARRNESKEDGEYRAAEVDSVRFSNFRKRKK